MSVLMAVTVTGVLLSGLLVAAVFRWIPQLAEQLTQRIERAQEATRRSNECLRQDNARHMDAFHDAVASNKLAEEMNHDVLREVLALRSEMLTLSATYHPHSDRSRS